MASSDATYPNMNSEVRNRLTSNSCKIMDANRRHSIAPIFFIPLDSRYHIADTDLDFACAQALAMLSPRVSRNYVATRVRKSGTFANEFYLGPIADNVKSEVSRTGDELRDLSNARVTPSTTTADGQPLTRM